jgi:hypothetical protein
MDRWMTKHIDEMMLHDILSFTIFPIAFSATPRLYSTLSSPCRSKQTMTGRMDDRTDGWMNDWTDGWMDDGTDG